MFVVLQFICVGLEFGIEDSWLRMDPIERVRVFMKIVISTYSPNDWVNEVLPFIFFAIIVICTE